MVIRLSIKLAAAVFVVALSLGCRPAAPVQQPVVDAPQRAILKQQPTVRVRIVSGASRIDLSASGRLWAQAKGHENSDRLSLGSPVTFTLHAGEITIQQANGQGWRWDVDAVRIGCESGGVIRVNQTPYPGQIVIHRQSGSDNGALRLDAINHVAMEQYLPGVLARELFRNWHINTFRAQAVAARSYAIAEMHENRSRHFDVESTVASQVYGGDVGHATARQAAADTAGVVLMWQDRIVRAYYSSCCGGSGQDAAAAFVGGEDIPPLRGSSSRHWCSASRWFRWGPVTRDSGELASRIRTWGRQNEHETEQLGSIADIRITARSSAGRPARFSIQDTRGRVFHMGPEQFRFACNSDAPGAAKLSDDAVLRSSHVDVHVRSPRVYFVNGRGHGHGVGMCQWCAQGMASEGRSAQYILEYFYPGAQLRRLYRHQSKYRR